MANCAFVLKPKTVPWRQPGLLLYLPARLMTGPVSMLHWFAAAQNFSMSGKNINGSKQKQQTLVGGTLR
jgi:hypothetical protein